MYDASLARFHTIDPLAENSISQSMYAYCLNNPLRYTDPSGLSSFDVICPVPNENGKYTVNTIHVNDDSQANSAQNPLENMSNEYAQLYAEQYGRELDMWGRATYDNMGLYIPGYARQSLINLGTLVLGTGRQQKRIRLLTAKR